MRYKKEYILPVSHTFPAKFFLLFADIGHIECISENFMIKLMPLLVLFFTSSLLASIGEISAIHGDATILRNGKVLSANMHTKIEEKDLIKTAQKTKLQIIFNDNTIISLGQNSSFKVQEYLFGAKKVKARFNVKGLFKSITGKIGHIAPKNFTLKTQNATIGVRGTTIIGESSSDKDTIICSSGKIIVHSARGEALVQMGQKTIVLKGAKPSTPVFIQKALIQKAEKKISLPREKKNTLINIPKKELLHEEIAVKTKEITEIKDDWGIWDSKEDISKEIPPATIQKEPSPSIPEDREDLSILREKAKEHNPRYSGKVYGFVNTPANKISSTDNHINLNFDLGSGDIDGDLAFKAGSEAWSGDIQNGRVDKHGAFDFSIHNQSTIQGAGDGMLSGEELEHANGTFQMKNETNNHQAYGTFKAGKQ